MMKRRCESYSYLNMRLRPCFKLFNLDISKLTSSELQLTTYILRQASDDISLLQEYTRRIAYEINLVLFK